MITLTPTTEADVHFILTAESHKHTLASRNKAIEFRRIVSVIQGRGVGRASLRAVKAYAFNTLEAHRLWLDVKSKNAKAQYLFKSEGFVEEEGVMRECLLEDGQFESLVLMSILRQEFEAGANRGRLP